MYAWVPGQPGLHYGTLPKTKQPRINQVWLYASVTPSLRRLRWGITNLRPVLQCQRRKRGGERKGQEEVAGAEVLSKKYGLIQSWRPQQAMYGDLISKTQGLECVTLARNTQDLDSFVNPVSVGKMSQSLARSSRLQYPHIMCFLCPWVPTYWKDFM